MRYEVRSTYDKLTKLQYCIVDFGEDGNDCIIRCYCLTMQDADVLCELLNYKPSDNGAGKGDGNERRNMR